MRSRPCIALSASDRATVARWSTGVVGTVVALIAAMLVLPVFQGHADNGGSGPSVQSVPDPICAALDRLASSVIAERARTEPVDVAEISDMIAYMRRGRRTCEIGWPQLACREYGAILNRAQNRAGHSFKSAPDCPEAHLASESPPRLE
jgi:hypothetical protein